ncbi:MAG: efflux RND transporter periplasmic adaptor subunit [Leptospiraceae bacterium]|nr:efflux RND transporter periplasmic adaptor subunit [Leptospiraceae bacterium]MCB1315198.1 efflux RND transporter periplasmic adaptor subunit [Leptospiraceae bacterium]MCB1321477.1 efflux RND transporter periplasmic adaptor subunit [Leptospiraceae bacterium]
MNWNLSIKNNTLRWAIMALVLIGITAGAWWYYSNESADVDSVRNTLYTCPMHPQIISDHPGRCPICGMELVPLEEHDHDPDDMTAHTNNGADEEDDATRNADGTGGDHSDHDSSVNQSTAPNTDRLIVRVEPAVIQKMGMTTAIVTEAPIAREIRAVAHIDFSERGEVIVNSRVSGWVEQLYARTTGERVRRGQPLAGIYSPELVSTQEEYLQLYRRYQRNQSTEMDLANRETEQLLQAARQRLKYWNISDAQIANIEKQNRAQRLLTVYAPQSGVIVEKKVIQGARIDEGTDLFKIVDLSTVWAYAHIPERDIPFIREGMPVTIETPQIPGMSFAANVTFVFPYLREDTRDLRIRISIPNGEYRLKPGMYATAIIKDELPGKHVLVPSSSVIRTGERNIAFAYLGNGRFEPREVRVGVTDNEGHLQILDGLQPGEAVVVSGQFLLDSETRIQEAVMKMRRTLQNQSEP